MTESEFLAAAEAVLDDLEAAVEAADADIECERSGNVLTLEFDDGSKIIVNLQTPMHEIWIAAKAGGFHFRFADDAWRDTRSGDEFYVALSQYATRQAGEPVELRPAR